MIDTTRKTRQILTLNMYIHVIIVWHSSFFLFGSLRIDNNSKMTPADPGACLWQKLSMDLLALVLSFLDVADHLRAALINKRFKAAGARRDSWATLQFTNPCWLWPCYSEKKDFHPDIIQSVSRDSESTVLSVQKLLERLRPRNLSIAFAITNLAVFQHMQPEHLVCRLCIRSNKQARDLKMPRTEKLSTLSLDTVAVSRKKWRAPIRKFLESCSCLTRLRLQDHGDVSDFLQSVEHQPLQHLVLEHSDLKANPSCLLAFAHTLQTLVLCNAGFPAANSCLLAQLTHLTDFSYVAEYDCGGQLQLQHLAQLPLRSLEYKVEPRDPNDLLDFFPADSTLAAFANGQCASTLTSISLTHTTVGLVGLKALTQYSRLRELSLTDVSGCTSSDMLQSRMDRLSLNKLVFTQIPYRAGIYRCNDTVTFNGKVLASFTRKHTRLRELSIWQIAISAMHCLASLEPQCILRVAVSGSEDKVLLSCLQEIRRKNIDLQYASLFLLIFFVVTS